MTEELVNLKILQCNNTRISGIPKELVNLETLYCNDTGVSVIRHSIE